jgi:hypothetical protein
VHIGKFAEERRGQYSEISSMCGFLHCIFGGSSVGADTTIMKNAPTRTYWLRENVTTFFTDKISIFVSFRIDVVVVAICTGVHVVLRQEIV